MSLQNQTKPSKVLCLLHSSLKMLWPMGDSNQQCVGQWQRRSATTTTPAPGGVCHLSGSHSVARTPKSTREGLHWQAAEAFQIGTCFSRSVITAFVLDFSKNLQKNLTSCLQVTIKPLSHTYACLCLIASLHLLSSITIVWNTWTCTHFKVTSVSGVQDTCCF